MSQSSEVAAMQLDEFISSTLTQIIAGVRQAQEAVVKYGAVINPQVEGQPRGELDPETGTFRKNVEFDIAVTVARATGSSAGLRVAAFGVGAGVDGKSDLHHSAVSRIKFSVLCVFPKQFARRPSDEGFVAPIK